MEQKLNWLITGGAGFIGRNLIKFLKENYPNNKVRILDNLSVGSREDLAYCTDRFNECDVQSANWENDEIELIVGDILDQDLVLKVSEGANVIVHLAANTGVGPSVENPRMDCTTNVVGTFNLLEAARQAKVSKFIFASSGAPIGECIPPIHEELPCHPVSPYGASKLAGEAYCSAYFRSFGLNTVALRFGNVYGPGSTKKASVVAKFIKLALNKETLEIYGDGKQTRDFIYVKDLVNSIYLSATKEVGGEIFQIATSRETTVSEITEKLVSLLKESGLQDINVIYGPKRVGDVMRNFSDTTKAKNVLGWETNYNLEQGLKETIAFFTD